MRERAVVTQVPRPLILGSGLLFVFVAFSILGYRLRMSDPAEKLTRASCDDLVAAITFALRYQDRKCVRHADRPSPILFGQHDRAAAQPTQKRYRERCPPVSPVLRFVRTDSKSPPA
jgi:hypothetical protein